MKKFSFIAFLISIFILTGCSVSRKTTNVETTKSSDIRSTVHIKNSVPSRKIDTKNVAPNQVVDFAETLMGIKYKYGGESTKGGFDCSGLVNYVFAHFNISVPRVSVSFTNVGTEIPIKKCRPGDIILFTGTNANSGVVGHLGIITENNNGDVQFIHASERGVIISGMNSYFVPRFVKVNRVFPD
ncbi:MAG: C40 family peptidase [Ginsengibacter sp.]